MPEGDTIARAAAVLHEALAGQTVTRFATALAHLARVDVDTPLAGRIVERCAAHGKHLLIAFSGGARAAHAHAHAWLVASLSPGRTLAAATRARCAS